MSTDFNCIPGEIVKKSGKELVFLGKVFGINLINLEPVKDLWVFTHVKDYCEFQRIHPDNLILEEKRQLSSIRKMEKTVSLTLSQWDQSVMEKLPLIPNVAYCPEKYFPDCFQRKGNLFPPIKSEDIGRIFRNNHPNYYIMWNDCYFRQTGFREFFPELILQLEEFEKDIFLEKGEFIGKKTIYVSTESLLKYGGKHKDFQKWNNLSLGNISLYMEDYQLGKWAKGFQFRENSLFNPEKTDKIRLLVKFDS